MMTEAMFKAMGQLSHAQAGAIDGQGVFTDDYQRRLYRLGFEAGWRSLVSWLEENGHRFTEDE